MTEATHRHARILSLTVAGGFLDGLHLDFESGLNCIIGGRGAGKRAAASGVRLALDDDRKDPLRAYSAGSTAKGATDAHR